MVLTRINLKLIKCEFWLDFIFFIFFKKYYKKNFSFMTSYLHIWKIFGDWYDPWKIQKKEKCSKKRNYIQQQRESQYWPRKRWNLVSYISVKIVENWISFQNTSIPNQLEFWTDAKVYTTIAFKKLTKLQSHIFLKLRN